MASITFHDRFKNKIEQVGKDGILRINSLKSVEKGKIPEYKLHLMPSFAYLSNEEKSMKNLKFLPKVKETENQVVLLKSREFIKGIIDLYKSNSQSPDFRASNCKSVTFIRSQIGSSRNLGKSTERTILNRETPEKNSRANLTTAEVNKSQTKLPDISNRSKAINIALKQRWQVKNLKSRIKLFN